MLNTDFYNLTLLEADERVDQINKKFYGRYKYPWPPLVFPGYPANIMTLFLNQDVGCWGHNRVPLNATIWVAGCGTNQALFTALKFPQAKVLATDISTQSLEVCRANAQQIGVTNLQLEEKSLNDIEYEDAFDYIICTGVVHHNANPEATLHKISRALKRNGVLELMVYNYFHRIMNVACQKAIRNFYDAASAIDIDLELKLLKQLVADFQYNNLMGNFIKGRAKMHEAEMTDDLVQPVEYSYTIESLNELAGNCNLEFLSNCQNQFDELNNAYTWNMQFKDSYLRDLYNSLPDVKRWQISNLLLFNESPMLWFYFQRKDSDIMRNTEQQLCDTFLATRFRKHSFQVSNYFLNIDGKYKLNSKGVQHPLDNNITAPILREIYKIADPAYTMKEIFSRLNIPLDFYEVNSARIKLTTSRFPYLLAVN